MARPVTPAVHGASLIGHILAEPQAELYAIVDATDAARPSAAPGGTVRGRQRRPAPAADSAFLQGYPERGDADRFGARSLLTLRVIDAVHKAARTGERVRIN